MPKFILYILAGILIIEALPFHLHLPYGVYTFTRIAICASAVYLLFLAFKAKLTKGFIFWALIATAIVFNPIVPIYLRQSLWMILDLTVALLFFYIAKTQPYIK